ncbi:hypothetical protein KEM54_003020 [Ascosphaera aggregata]|nr:hypothetical protein KEM54_003020 [Ascosphaera aggregata]
MSYSNGFYDPLALQMQAYYGVAYQQDPFFPQMISALYISPYIDPAIYSTQAMPQPLLHHFLQYYPQPQVTVDERQILDDAVYKIREQCRCNLRQIFHSIARGKLIEAQEHLITVSQWLTANYEHLGLSEDIDSTKAHGFKMLDARDKAIIGDGSAFFKMFNNCWLALFTRQLEYIEAKGKDGWEPPELITRTAIVRLGDEVESIANALDKPGLVDFQFGFAEHEIIKGE